MKRFRLSPALVISLIALFVALGGTSYAAITTLPANSVGTKQLKTAAVTGTKLSPAVIRYFLHAGSTLPSGKTEVGDWGGGNFQGADGGGGSSQASVTFPLPLTSAIGPSHVVIVSGASAAHCAGVGQAAAGYLCVYVEGNIGATIPVTSSVYNPESNDFSQGSGRYGFGIYLAVAVPNADWLISGTYAVTAP
jgi:hypothetical protein